ERSELVLLLFEDVRIDRAGPDAVSIGERRDARGARDPVRKIPEHVQRERGACAGEPVHFARVAEFLLDRRRGRRLQKLSEPRARVGKAPGRQLDAERVERRGDPVGQWGHDGQSSDSGTVSATVAIAQYSTEATPRAGSERNAGVSKKIGSASCRE